MNKQPIGFWVLTFVCILFIPNTARAHVRWFVDDLEKYADQHYSADLTTVLVTIGALLFIILARAIDLMSSRWKTDEAFNKAIGLTGDVEWRIIAALTGFMFVAHAAMGIFLAPNLSLPGKGLLLVSRIGQMALGLLLLSQISLALCALLILSFSVLALIYIPLELMIDYLAEFGALILCFLILGPNMCPLDQRLSKRLKIDFKRFEHLPLPIIRIGLGLTLIVLSIHNKLLTPALPLAFLDQHTLNFMPYLGFANFTNLHFAYSAGVAELTLGFLLVTGVATRFTAMILAAFFLATLFTIGSLELTGHAPLFGILLLLVVRGSGSLRLELRSRLMGRSC